jgi:hypothetical protein
VTADQIRARLDELAAPFTPPTGWVTNKHTDDDCWCWGTQAEGLHSLHERRRGAERAFDALRAVLDLPRVRDRGTDDDYGDGWVEGYAFALLRVERAIADALGVAE